jgi:hypothetical protein
VGTLSVFVDDLFKPVLITPLNLDATLQLNRGRAWVGFTAATGDATYQVSQSVVHQPTTTPSHSWASAWRPRFGSALAAQPGMPAYITDLLLSRVALCPQVHDLLDWTFTSLRVDPASHPPPVVNGVGAYSCANASVCIHP